jgi:hypothetical protein
MKIQMQAITDFSQIQCQHQEDAVDWGVECFFFAFYFPV